MAGLRTESRRLTDRERAVIQEARELHFIWGNVRSCVEIAVQLKQDLGWDVEDGQYEGPDWLDSPNLPIARFGYYHAWNRLEDGTIVDADADQFSSGESVRVIPPGDPRQDWYRKGGSTAMKTAGVKALYHGTNVSLSVGDEVRVAKSLGIDRGWESPHYDSALVYLTDQDWQAARYAISAAKKMGGRPHVYRVRPSGVVKRDPEYEATGFGSDQYVADGAVVVEEVPIEPIIESTPRLKKLMVARTVRFYHGTNQAALDRIRQEGFKALDPEETAHEIERRYGLPHGSVWGSSANEFSRSRKGDPYVYLSGDRKTAERYAEIGSEVVFDSLLAAFYELYPEEREQYRSPRSREWVRNETGKHYRPMVVELAVPIEEVYKHHVERVGPMPTIKDAGEFFKVVPVETWTTLMMKAPLPASWIRSVQKVGYRGGHQPFEEGDPLHDLGSQGTFPSDVYDHPEWYSFGEWTAECARVIRAVRGKPDALVWVYRAVPEGVKGINTGDWVTISEGYARQHAMRSDDPSEDWPVLKAQVKAKHVRSGGSDIIEWGYFGPPVANVKLAAVRPEDRYRQKANIVGRITPNMQVHYNRTSDTLTFVPKVPASYDPNYLVPENLIPETGINLVPKGPIGYSSGAVLEVDDGAIWPSEHMGPTTPTMYNPLYIEALQRLLDTFPQFGSFRLYEALKPSWPVVRGDARDWLYHVNEMRAEYVASKTAQRNAILLFHGTVRLYAERIMREGIKPRDTTNVLQHWQPSAASWAGRVYLSHPSRLTISRSAMHNAQAAAMKTIMDTRPEVAKQIYERGKPGTLYVNDFPLDIQRLLEPVLLRVTIPRSGWKNLRPDEDELEYAQRAAEETGMPEWMASIGSMGVVAYQGNVPAGWISVYLTGDAAWRAGMVGSPPVAASLRASHMDEPAVL